MSNLACPCGHVLKDVAQADAECYWGRIASNGEIWKISEEAAAEIALLCEHYKEGTHTRWLEERNSVYANQPLDGIISDLLAVHRQALGLWYGRCPACGSLLIQKAKEDNHCVRYAPENSNQSEGI